MSDAITSRIRAAYNWAPGSSNRISITKHPAYPRPSSWRQRFKQSNT